MDQRETVLAPAGRAVQGLMGIADLLDRNPHDQRIAAAIRSLALEIDESLGATLATAEPPTAPEPPAPPEQADHPDWPR